MLSRAQGQAPSPPTAKPSDVSSIDAILDAAYDVISGPATQKRDWDRFRSLFLAQAHFIIASPKPAEAGGAFEATVLDVDSFIAGFNDHIGTEGFLERDIARRVVTYENMTHVFSTYESRHREDDVKPFVRGINSFQLLNDGKRWWIVDIFWQEEDASHPIPGEYLRGGKR